MKKLLTWFTNLFLLKMITSREGVVHFRRWGIQTRWLSIFVHNIAKSDEDKDPHDHPWSYVSFVLVGGYFEDLLKWNGKKHNYKHCGNFPFSVIYRSTKDFHKLRLMLNKPAWTLVITGPRTHDLWGYMTPGGFVDHKTYRKNKNASRV